MDAIRMEQMFDSLRMSLSYGYISSARNTFETTINQHAIDKLYEIIKIMQSKGYEYLLEDIEKLKDAKLNELGLKELEIEK